ncbi:hypothetical protein [Paenibacillus ferrarius]|nr:hypothetical protein [Paenibacillus ferrarius]
MKVIEEVSSTGMVGWFVVRGMQMTALPFGFHKNLGDSYANRFT